jgi:AraC-like DNA-binding protein
MDDLQIELGANIHPESRAELWRERIPLIFEGLRVVTGPGFGPATMTAYGLSAGRLIVFAGNAHRIERRTSGRDASSGTLNIVLQTGGEATFAQGGRKGRLSQGDVVLIDGAQPLDLELGDDYGQILIQLPRDLVARRHEGVVCRVGERLGSNEPAAQILFDMTRALAGRLDRLPAELRPHAFESIVGFLGVLTAERCGSPSDRRFTRAVMDIDTNLSDPDLGGERLAALQGISRRRLESVFAERGQSVSRTIWDRRLERIASALVDPSQAHLRIVDIALAWGFNSEAHFSRTFHKKYGQSPRAYRRHVSDGSVPPIASSR